MFLSVNILSVFYRLWFFGLRSCWGQAELWNVADWKSVPSACLELQLTSHSDILSPSCLRCLWNKQQVREEHLCQTIYHLLHDRFAPSRQTSLGRAAEDADTFGCTHQGDMGAFSSTSVSLTGTHTLEEAFCVSRSRGCHAWLSGGIQASKGELKQAISSAEASDASGNRDRRNQYPHSLWITKDCFPGSF